MGFRPAESHSGQDPSRLGQRRRTWKLASSLQGIAETVSAGPRQRPGPRDRQVGSGPCQRFAPLIDVCIVVCDRIHTFRHYHALETALNRLRVRSRPPSDQGPISP